MKKRLAGFEELVLLATASLGEEAYGVTVQQRLEAETGSAVALGAVYAVLDRLERKGYARSAWRGDAAARGPPQAHVPRHRPGPHRATRDGPHPLAPRATDSETRMKGGIEWYPRHSVLR